ncbi:hypothetical protein [Nocardia nova]|uniref:hypothetical protein n=1 Tax=Nocardia nova TaxID=37330 RepID=UPI0033C8D265
MYGQQQWRRTLALFPERFAAAERREAELREQLGDYSILTEQRNGNKYPLPLSELRRRTESPAQPNSRRQLTANGPRQAG